MAAIIASWAFLSFFVKEIIVFFFLGEGGGSPKRREKNYIRHYLSHPAGLPEADFSVALKGTNMLHSGHMGQQFSN